MLVGVSRGKEEQEAAPMGLNSVQEKQGEERKSHGVALHFVFIAFKLCSCNVGWSKGRKELRAGLGEGAGY